MPLFQLLMQKSEDSWPETIQFIAADLQVALRFANQRTTSLPAELSEGGVRVCELRFSRTN